MADQREIADGLSAPVAGGDAVGRVAALEGLDAVQRGRHPRKTLTPSDRTYSAAPGDCIS